MGASAIVEITVFAAGSFVAIAGALGMTTTMSMFRSGIFLMASFVGVAALFILLAADLLGLLQIMMYVGGMLVMVLFMVLFMQDPGGAMMAAMPGMMSPIESLFSRGLLPVPAPGEEEADMGDMDDMDMAMVTPVRRIAAWLAGAAGAALVAMLVLRPAWPVREGQPDPGSAAAIGRLLMEKYMVGFEAAGFLILIGIFGAVFLGSTGRRRRERPQSGPVAEEAAPAPIEPDGLGRTPPGDGR